MQTFAQPQLSADKWWAQMLPLLSQQGGVAYEGRRRNRAARQHGGQPDRAAANRRRHLQRHPHSPRRIRAMAR